MTARKDYTGIKFSSLTAIKFSHIEKGHTYWVFDCECGNKCIKEIWNVKTGHTESCGCATRDKRARAKTTHGLSHTRFHKIYTHLFERCYNPRSSGYEHYGARGITVCDRWCESFENFIEDMYSTYEDHLTIQRVDRSKGYSPDNCVWLEREKQVRDRGKMKNNTSGVTGVTKSVKSDCATYWVACWRDLDGKPCNKAFRIERLGDDEAFHQACEYRAKMIEELNKQGAGYSPSHGI